jgi:hypothetical protein
MELIQDEKKKRRAASGWSSFLVALEFLYGVIACCGRSHN